MNLTLTVDLGIEDYAYHFDTDIDKMTTAEKTFLVGSIARTIDHVTSELARTLTDFDFEVPPRVLLMVDEGVELGIVSEANLFSSNQRSAEASPITVVIDSRPNPTADEGTADTPESEEGEVA